MEYLPRNTENILREEEGCNKTYFVQVSLPGTSIFITVADHKNYVLARNEANWFQNTAPNFMFRVVEKIVKYKEIERIVYA